MNTQHDDDYDYGPRMVVRPLTAEDYDAVVGLQRKCFKTIQPWLPGQFTSQLQHFPEGQIGVELDGELVATSSCLIIDSTDLSPKHTFEDVTDHCMIRNHDEEGDSLYGIDIAVDPEFRGMRIARRIYEERKRLVRDYNLRRILIAGRMPGYHEHANVHSPSEYVKAVLARELDDPVITAQLANGFAIRAVIRGYLPSDQESKGNAVLMQWLNPDYVPEEGRRKDSGNLRVASVQYQMRPVGSFDDFAKQCEFFVDTAGDYHCDFLLFPELLTNQLLALVGSGSPEATARRLDEYTPQYLDLFTNLALRYYVNIIGGSHLTLEDDVLYNIAYLFRRDGSVAKQYKIHITPAEARWWGVSPGSRLEVFDTDRGKIAINICYDVEFPELARIATSKGAHTLFVPYNTDIRSGYIRVRACGQSRCIENHIYTVMAGACGNLPEVEGADIHYAQSCILTPSDISFARDGIGAEATPNVETMLVHDLDLDVLRRTRSRGTVRTWLDRRTDIYGVRFMAGDEESVV